jgi:hypothetical protein
VREAAERGSAVWDGDSAPEATVDGETVLVRLGTGPEAIAGSLAEFVAALRGGPPPRHGGAPQRGQRGDGGGGDRVGRPALPVLLKEVLESAYAEALSGTDGELRDVLHSWGSAVSGLAAGRH